MLLVHNIFRQTPQIETKFYSRSFYYLFAFIFAINHIIIITQRCDIDQISEKYIRYANCTPKASLKLSIVKNQHLLLFLY